ncbi:MAG: hypothetical protein JRE47_13450 [Deltaproteobacteria bacterium]|nr:hypothetical protein [Deltaproteobacteria bacterium]
MTVGIFISGCLYETIGSFALFALSGFIALAGGAVFKGSQMLDVHLSKPT